VKRRFPLLLRLRGLHLATRLPYAALLFLLAACGDDEMSPPAPFTVTGGVAERGRSILEANRYGYAACHVIPGIAGTRGMQDFLSPNC
jgi:hypothetical protein